MSTIRCWSACLAVLLPLLSQVSSGQSPSGSPDLVISQVYGGGGSVGAPYNADFIEVYNRSRAPVSLSGLSLQYANATGTGMIGSPGITRMPDVVLLPGQFFLVREGGGINGAPLPQPFYAAGAPIAISATGGKVALVRGTAPLGCNGVSTPCSPAQLANIIDLVGFGDADFFEGSGAALGASDTTAVIRNNDGQADSDDNLADFTSGRPTPRNTANVVAMSIDDVAIAEGDAANPAARFTVGLNNAALVPVTFTIETADETATAGFDYVAQPAQTRTLAVGERRATFDVTILADLAVERDETFVVRLTNVTGVAVADDRGVGTILNDDAYVPAADLTTTTDVPAVVVVGGAFTYEVTVWNAGPDSAEAVIMTTTLPASAAYESVLAPEGWTCIVSGAELRCDAALLAAGATARFVVSMRADCAAPEGAVLSSRSSATSPTEHTNFMRDNASADAGVVSNPPPLISGASVDTPVLPPDGRMHPIHVSYSVSDSCGVVSAKLAVHSSDTGAQGWGVDWVVLTDHDVLLLAEKLKHERIYTITITAKDAVGNVSTEPVVVTLPRRH